MTGAAEQESSGGHGASVIDFDLLALDEILVAETEVRTLLLDLGAGRAVELCEIDRRRWSALK